MPVFVWRKCSGKFAGKVIGNNQMCLSDESAGPMFLVNGCQTGLERGSSENYVSMED